MFFSSISNKTVSILVVLILVMSWIAVPSMAEDNDIINTDFSDYTSPGGTTAPPGMNIFNAVSGKAQCLPVEDEVYGTTAQLSLSVDSMKYLALGKYITSDPTRVFVLETAVKRHDIAGADFAIDLWSGGKQLVKFDKSGKLYVGDKTLVGTYESDVWYELKIEYLASSKQLKVKINGGKYENTVISKEWEQIAFTELDFGMRNCNDSAASDASIAFCKMYYTDTMNVYDNIQVSFDNYDEGNLSNSALSSTSSKYEFANGFTCSFAHERAFSMEEVVPSRGKSMAMESNGGVNQFVLPLGNNYINKFESGIYYMDFSASVGTNMLLQVIADGTGTDVISGKNGYFFPLYMGADNSYIQIGSVDKAEDRLDFAWENNKWYDFSFAFDMDSKTLTFTIANPDDEYDTAQIIRSIEGFTDVTKLAIASGSFGTGHTLSYIDDIKVYEEAPLEVLSINPPAGTGAASLTGICTVRFNMPLLPNCASTDNVSFVGGGLTEEDYDIYIIGKTALCIQAHEGLEPNTEYTVTINSVSDIFGSSIDTPVVLTFTTSEFIYITAPQYTWRGENTDMSTTIKFNDGVYRDVLVLYGVYDKATNALLAFDTQSANRALMNANLTVMVPGEGEYSNEVMILDTYRGLKPYTPVITDTEPEDMKYGGTESLTVNSSTQTVTLSGKATVPGDVVIAVLNPGYTAESLSGINKEGFHEAINYIRQITTDSDGNYALSYKMDGTSGDYTVLMNYAQSPADAAKIYDFTFYSPKEVAGALTAINGAEDADDIRSVAENNSHLLGLDMTVYTKLSDDGKNAVAAAFFGDKEKAGGFADTTKAAESFIIWSVVAKFGEVDSAEELILLIDGYGEVIGLTKSNIYQSYESLDSDGKLAVCEEITKAEFTDTGGLVAAFSEIVFTESVNSLTNWGDLRPLIESNADLLSAMNVKKYLSIKDSSTIDKRIVKMSFDSIEEFCDAVDDEVNEYNSSSSSSSKKSLGGGSSGGGIGLPAYPVNPDADLGKEPLENDGASVSGIGSEFPFKDMDGALWAKEAVAYLYSKGVINGKSASEFAPDALVTREEFAKILVEAFATADFGMSPEFEDTNSGAWYAPYVATAVKLGFVRGMGDGRFGTGMNITRQDMCTMVWRAAESIGFINDSESELVFADSHMISDYATGGISAMYAGGYINGMGNNNFAPLDNATRAQAAQIVYRIITDKEAN